ncbi:hypothetical protein H0H93_015743 [Arthromyces matolae]|nr:hypothetical protein H0H93_015743 [Arthromyces matolae]
MERRFVYISSQKSSHGTKETPSGVYTSMPFCLGGRKRAPFPMNIECTTAENADTLLRLLQPLADQLYGKDYLSVFKGLMKSRRWTDACKLMQTQAHVFYAVGLGKHVGIFIDRSAAARSLDDTESVRYRRCDRFSTFSGAYKSMASNAAVNNDYLGQGLVDASPNDDDHLFDSDDENEGDNPVLPSTPPPATPSSPSPPPLPMPQATSFCRENLLRSAAPLAQGGTHINLGLSPSLSINIHGSASQADARQSRFQSPSPTKVPRPVNFGPWFTLYLETHSFSSNVALIAEQLFHRHATSEENFIKAFTQRVDNVEHGEARFLFLLMSECPGLE